MKLVKDKVIELLRLDTRYRDDDNKLIARIWHEEFGRLEGDSAMDLLKALALGKLTSSESIRRSRQKTQEEHPELRGTKYKIRHEEAEEFKKQLFNN
jgi:hypothetical protein